MSARHRLFTVLAMAALLATAGFASDGASTERGEDPLAAIRARIRAEVGVQEDWNGAEAAPSPEATVGADLPMVGVLVLPGDTYKLLAQELTGTQDSVKILRAICPDLRPGEKMMLPGTLLLPRLGDPALEHFVLDASFPTLYGLAEAKLDVAKEDVPAMVRNLQRLNAIPDPKSAHVGTKIDIPAALLKTAAPRVTSLNVNRGYRAFASAGFASAKQLKGRRQRSKAVVHGTESLTRRTMDVDLVVLHTTEHSGTSFESVAAYIRRNRLANYLIGPKGEIYEIVPENYRAFGCGESLWEGRREVDQRAINIEIFADTAPGTKYSGISGQQYAGLKKLLDDIHQRRPRIHQGRVVTHSMVAVSYKYNSRSRKGDPYEFDWLKAGLPNNMQRLDQDVLLGRVTLCRDKRFADRITPGQSAAAELLNKM